MDNYFSVRILSGVEAEYLEYTSVFLQDFGEAFLRLFGIRRGITKMLREKIRFP